MADRPAKRARRHDGGPGEDGDQSQAGQLFAFDGPTGAWTAYDAPPEVTTAEPRKLKLATWNVWSCEPGRSYSQTYYVMSVLSQVGADVIALQEVGKTMETSLRKQAWVRKGYVMSRVDDYWRVAGYAGRIDKGGRRKQGAKEAVLWLVRKSLVDERTAVSFSRLDATTVERGKALVTLSFGVDETVKLTTAHLSSMPFNADVRALQLESIVDSLELPSSPRAISVFLGDLNTADESELEPFVEAGLVDCAGEDDRPTFGDLFPVVKGADPSKPRKARRIDRVYCARRDSSVVVEYGLFGEQQVRDKDGRLMKCREGKDGKLWPSDHLGVLVELEWPSTSEQGNQDRLRHGSSKKDSLK